MLDALQQGFFLFANWQNLMLLGLGVIIGTFVGAVPGMTTPMAVSKLESPMEFAASNGTLDIPSIDSY